MRNAVLEETQAGIQIAGRNINHLRYADDTTLMAESEEELKSLLMKVKVESEEVGLKLNIQETKIMASGPITSWEIDGETVETVSDFTFSGSKITADGDSSHEIKRRLLLGRKVMTNLDSIFKSRDITLPTKVHLVKAMGFSCGHVCMWELDCEEGWVPKNWCFWTVVLEKTLESALDCKEIQPVHSEGDQPWDFFGSNDAKAEIQYFGQLLWRVDSLEKTLAMRDWGQEEKGMTEDEMAGLHHWLNGLESEWTLGAGDGQGGLACCDSWGRKESDMTEWLNWTELMEQSYWR